jgi:hypothetical protein
MSNPTTKADFEGQMAWSMLNQAPIKWHNWLQISEGDVPNMVPFRELIGNSSDLT